MCGRFGLDMPPRRAAEYFECLLAGTFDPDLNITPGRKIPVIIRNSATSRRELHLLRWGLVPHWADDDAPGRRMINARAETAADRPAFRDAFSRRRCIVPATVYYEWKKEPGGSMPHRFFAADGSPLALGAVWERWRSPDGILLHSTAILTTAANSLAETVHHRMPVIIGPADLNTWLNPTTSPGDARTLTSPAAPDALRAQALPSGLPEG